MLKVITVTNDMEATRPLISSLAKHGWNAEIILTEWKGFGTKLIATYNYLKDHPEVTEFVFCDAFDVVALGGVEEFHKKLPKGYIICSAERGCWPDGTLEKYYIKRYKHRFNYLNSGLYYANSKSFIELFESNQPMPQTDDQLWFTEEYLFNELSGIVLDNGQKVFNSHSFIDDGEYGYERGRVQVNGNEPLFCHFNGRTVDEKFNEMIKI